MNSIEKGELARKSVHYSASLIPIIYFFVEKKLAVAVLLACSILILTAELLRMYNSKCNTLYMKIFGWMTRPHEHSNHLTGATYVFISCFITVLLFPKEIAIMTILFLTVGDPTAYLIGKAFGNGKFLGKSLEGTAAFIIAGFLATIWIPGIPVTIKLLGVVIAAIIELIPLGIDDNLTIPIITSFIIILLS
jgi:glycerol-3-phosphate acyltransferase PlsY